MRWRLDLSRSEHAALKAVPVCICISLLLHAQSGGAIMLNGDKDRFPSRAELKFCTLSLNHAQAARSRLVVNALCLDIL